MADMLTISVAYSPRAGEVDLCEVTLPAGSCVADALRASGLAQRYPALKLDAAALGVWGVRAGADQLLRDRDRVEVYRPLLIEPMQARRRRQQQQREQAAAARKTRRR
ncbi:MAG TPA: RnfH family protein [Burkholderiaceae bacterium]|nr:RnfH family protein [Burkholderiaceae bacterium]